MSTMEKTAKKAVSVGPLVVEADHPRNGDLLLQGIINCRLRSRIKATKEVYARRKGVQVKRPAPAGLIPGLPAHIAGMELHLNPAQLSWKVVDPLCDDEETLEDIREAIKAHSGISVSSKLQGVPTKEGTLNKDQMKTLVREVFHLLKNEQARQLKGAPLHMEDIDDLPGKYLLNARNTMNWKQPRYEEDLEAWEETLNRLGGV